ncbi:hypothetical protein [Nocardia sp. NPDC059239]|uniref:hypothetical protein n=1 Tax=unclassified Nocardia TaxID=2637762 RepID=UPI0036B669E2
MNDFPQGAGPWREPDGTWHPPQSTRPRGLTTIEQQFLRDAAAAKVISNDPNVKADVNLQDANKADEANDPYQEALDESTTTRIHLSHDDAAKLVGLAIEDVCPTAGK